MSNFGSSVWNVLWVLGIPGVGMAGWVMLTAWRRHQWFYFFDAKHNPGLPSDAGDFKTHWKRYEGLAKLSITLSAGAVAFLINLLVNPNTSSNGLADRVRHGAPLAIGFFGAAIFLLLVVLLWMTYCYEQYSHSKDHDTYRAWKYALSQTLGSMGFLAFLLGFLWLGNCVSAASIQTKAPPAVTNGIPAASSGPAGNALQQPQPSGSVLNWFSSEHSLALATWGLVVVTLLLVLDGYRKSREQQKQWEEEGQRRAEEAKPSAVVEIAVKEATPLDMCFACFNLGNNTFYIDKMIVTVTEGAYSEADLTPQVVTPGTWVAIDYNPAELLGVFGENVPFREANCVFLLKGATGTVKTEPVWFYFGYGNNRANWSKGRLADRQPGTIPSQPKVIRIPQQ